MNSYMQFNEYIHPIRSSIYVRDRTNFSMFPFDKE